VGGTEAAPAQHVWDTFTGEVGWTSAHAIERSVLKGPGTYNVKVQYWVDKPQATFQLFGYHMTVERIIQ
jgi:hypothetical protein